MSEDRIEYHSKILCKVYIEGFLPDDDNKPTKPITCVGLVEINKSGNYTELIEAIEEYFGDFDPSSDRTWSGDLDSYIAIEQFMYAYIDSYSTTTVNLGDNNGLIAIYEKPKFIMLAEKEGFSEETTKQMKQLYEVITGGNY